MSQTPVAPSLSGKMFLYEQPELLNPERHAALGVKPLDAPFAFAAKIRALPVTVSEIPSAAHHYPVIFASKDNPQPLAVVGVIDDVNLFVEDDGRWTDYTYIPGYARRYPFGAANESGSERYAIVIDTAYAGFDPNGESKLFTGGEATDFTKNAIEFTRRYEEDRKLTMQFGDILKKFDLISGQTAHYTPDGGGQQVPFAQYLAIDEQRIKDLSDDTFLEVRRSGILPLVYAHIMSMNHWRSLVQRRARRFGLTEQSVFQPLPIS